MRLSILICSLDERKYFLDRILSLVNPQIDGADVEVLVDLDNREKTIGKKRNDLLDRAKGDYVCFVDDDDIIPSYYIKEIMQALTTSPDCVGFKGVITTNNQNPRTFIHTLSCEKWHEENGRYYRCPNHWNPIKRVFALEARFPEICWGEDHQYSMAVKPLLKTEVYIDKNMYYYLADNEMSVASKRRSE